MTNYNTENEREATERAASCSNSRNEAAAEKEENIYDDGLYEYYIRKDQGDADLFLIANENRFLYTPEINKSNKGQWFLYDNKGVWERVIQGRVRTEGMDRLRKCYEDRILELKILCANERTKNEDLENKISEREKEISKLLGNYYTRLGELNRIAGINAVVGIVQLMVETRAEEWDSVDRDIIACQNKILNIRTQEEVTPSRHHMLSFRIPAEFQGVDVPCPEFENYLFNCFNGDMETIRSVKMILGYVLLGTGNEQVGLFLYGEARSGKGTLIHMLHEAFGNLIRQMPSNYIVSLKNQYASTNSPDPWGMAIEGKRALIFSETTDGGYINEALFKELTGQDRKAARGCHKDPKDNAFENNAVPIFLTNHLPQFKAGGEAIWDRVIVIEYPNIYTKEGNLTSPKHKLRDTSLREKLQPELSGILAYALQGIQDYLSHTEQAGKGLYLSPEIIERCREYREDEEWFERFVLENFTIVNDMNATVTVRQAYVVIYQEEFREDTKGVLSNKSFSSKMKTIIAKANGWKTSQVLDRTYAEGRFYRGLQVRDRDNIKDYSRDTGLRPICKDPTPEEVILRNPDLDDETKKKVLKLVN